MFFCNSNNMIRPLNAWIMCITFQIMIDKYKLYNVASSKISILTAFSTCSGCCSKNSPIYCLILLLKVQLVNIILFVIWNARLIALSIIRILVISKWLCKTSLSYFRYGMQIFKKMLMTDYRSTQQLLAFLLLEMIIFHLAPKSSTHKIYSTIGY